MLVICCRPAKKALAGLASMLGPSLHGLGVAGRKERTGVVVGSALLPAGRPRTA